MSNPRYALCDRERQRRRWRVQGLPCGICGQPIDYSLRCPDPWSFVVDEIIPLKHGGTLTYDNQEPAHWWCNRVKSTHSLAWAQAEVRRLKREGKAPKTMAERALEQAETPVVCSDWFNRGGGRPSPRPRA